MNKLDTVKSENEFSADKSNATTEKIDVVSSQNESPNERAPRDITIVRPKPKNKIILGPGSTYGQVFSSNNFSSQYEDECPVNYSLKYSETESCKNSNKCDTTQKKFKDYSDYAETDLDQPTNFSLKYAEKNYEDDNKNSACNFYSNHKTKYKPFTDYVETDLDQPTDFTLKYRESVEEDVKNLNFNYFDNERKASTTFVSHSTTDDSAPERLPECYPSQNETPLMFSRSSSMNSLSSFAHITQSIPDDRSSVVSDFSRMTSGIISPSELPDSPTQTAPSSPKRNKSSVFPSRAEFLAKRSVFEDDVATYKQEGTPIEFSRATSLSSLNIDNPVKPEVIIKQTQTTSTLVPKEKNRSIELIPSEHIKQTTLEKIEHEKGKFELASVLEVDENVLADCISIDIQINCRNSKPISERLVMSQDSNTHSNTRFPVKPSLRLRFLNENRKGFSTYEGADDDAVHTYHTEGTPANISHAGSQSDLSALSIASGVPITGIDDNSDNESFFQEESVAVSAIKAETLENCTKIYKESETRALLVSKKINREIFVNSRPPLVLLRKDHQLMAKDETATFAMENSPCDISMRSSLSDLTINVMETPLNLNRGENCEEPPSQMLSPLRNVSPQSPNSIVFEEVEDAEKSLEEPQNEFISSESVNPPNEDWTESISPEEDNTGKDIGHNKVSDSKAERMESTNYDFDSEQPLTPFEEALVEECIRLGMPQKKTHFKPADKGEASEKPKEGEFNYSKTNFARAKCISEKKNSLKNQTSETNSPNTINFDVDSSEPLTLFEEVLLEQCIRLGMPQKRGSKKIEEAKPNFLDKETENFDDDSTEIISPLETILLEQCIRLGMPQKKSQKKEASVSDESNNTISSLSAHLNKLKINAENENSKDLKKCENCSCGKKHNNRRKGAICKKTKNRLDHIKVESCPV